MPVVPFDPARARPRGQARPPKFPPTGTPTPTGANGTMPPPRAAGSRLPVGPLPPAFRLGAPHLPGGVRPPQPALPPGTVAPQGSARSEVRLSADTAAGVMMPAHMPPAPPRLAVNLSPSAATRVLSMLGLSVAFAATVAATLAAIVAVPNSRVSAETPEAIGQFMHWLVSVPWLFLAVVLGASSRVERMVRPEVGPAWATLAFTAAACGAMQVVGRDLVSTLALVTRAGLILVAAAALSLAFRQFLAGPSKQIRLQIVGGAFGGLLAGLGPFALVGVISGATGASYGPLDALLNGADALLGLVLATFTVHATLVYVRDFLPDFNIALETAANSPEPELAAAGQ